jgi:hypothetical protein
VSEEEVHRKTTGESLDEQHVLVSYSSKTWTPTLTSLILHIGLIYTGIWGYRSRSTVKPVNPGARVLAIPFPIWSLPLMRSLNSSTQRLPNDSLNPRYTSRGASVLSPRHLSTVLPCQSAFNNNSPRQLGPRRWRNRQHLMPRAAALGLFLLTSHTDLYTTVQGSWP